MYDSTKRTGFRAGNNDLWFSFRDFATENLLAVNDLSSEIFKAVTSNSRWPHYNIIATETGYILELACAGFNKDELTVKVDENGLLVVEGRHLAKDGEGPEYLYHGISNKSFKTSFVLRGNSVDGVSFVDGLLKITITKTPPKETVLDIN